MNEKPSTTRRVLGIGLAWTTLWLGFWVLFVGIIGIIDPDSIDPGEGPLTMLGIFGPMGLATGILFGMGLSVRGRGKTGADRSLPIVVGWGVLATAIVQLAYLGHGDQGLVANIKMALLFASIGGIVTAVWRTIARRWPRGRADSLAP